MIKLYSFGPAFGLPDTSPFVTKVDLYLRINNLQFESIANKNNLGKAPKNKLPFIDDDGEIIGDSVFIIEHLNQKHKLSLDNWLNDEQKALGQLISKSLDENFYWCIVHSRWVDEKTWPMVRDRFFGDIPFPLNKIIPPMIRKTVQKQIMGHGMAKHSDAEIQQIADRTLNSLSVMLGDKKYFFGDQPCSFDVTAFAMVSAFTLSTLDNEMNQLSKKYDNLVSFTQRIHQQYYDD